MTSSPRTEPLTESQVAEWVDRVNDEDYRLHSDNIAAALMPLIRAAEVCAAPAENLYERERANVALRAELAKLAGKEGT